ncbi:MAG: shikimate dehydrogenase [Rhodoferax sp.]|uniref:shikimate dehydrogenase n=1 Tax=Rhodoferax sp. TaxID=50421 RepID=UPI0017F40746|nr:shikimate dehydrogenase [Rhodoferax sp.]NMM13661.1 shikimate dehydrogenase [Rhodoferax sp.]NMM20522.1 shikimate dehydrogenase [Rhodoferax sp.]
MSMDLYCVMGNPVEHSRSPWIHARFAELTGQSLHYDKRLIPLDGFATAVSAFVAEGGRGCNITVPFKFEAAALATHTSERAMLALASNVLTFRDGDILADNTDGAGLVNDIQRNAGVDLQGRRVLLIGAGGAAAGVLGPLILAQPAGITVANRTLSKASELVERHAALALLQKTELTAHDLQGLEANFDVLINATASSLSGAEVPVAASTLKPGALAYDMMYGPAAQGFLTWAREHGAVARDGLGMLVEQAAESFLIWRGVLPPSQPVLAELRAILR